MITVVLASTHYEGMREFKQLRKNREPSPIGSLFLWNGRAKSFFMEKAAGVERAFWRLYPIKAVYKEETLKRLLYRKKYGDIMLLDKTVL